MFVTVSLLLVAACLVPAAAKLLSHPKMRHAAAHFRIPWPRYQLIGAAELAVALTSCASRLPTQRQSQLRGLHYGPFGRIDLFPNGPWY